jgi:hypothetical protein
MFRAILMTQWKWARSISLLVAIMGFAVPIASLRTASATPDTQTFLTTMQGWGIAYALLALMVGLLVALSAWGHDHAGRHVYALSLPISRTRYVLLRFAAGLILLAPAIVGVLAGTLVVAASGAIPSGLHAFPIALTLRFTLCALLAFALFFAIGSATTRTAAIVLGAFGGVVFAQYLLSVGGADFNVLEYVAEFLFVSPGVLSVFSGRWMLVDV